MDSQAPPHTDRLVKRAEDALGGGWSLNSPTRFALRMTLSAVASFWLSQVLRIPLHGIWAVLTAAIVTQASVGASIGASLQYVLGTLGGALYAVCVALLIPHATRPETTGALALSIAPLAYAAAVSNAFRVAPFTAVILLLLAGEFGQGPLAEAATRLSEVVLGGAVAVLVSLLFFPERAYQRAKRAAALSLEELADGLQRLLAGFSRKLERGEVQQIQDGLGTTVASFDTIVADVRHEQAVSLGSRPNASPLLSTLLRLRHDLVIIGRAAASPLPELLLSRLSPCLSATGSATRDYLLASAKALRRGESPPSATQVEAAMNAYATEVMAIRAAGLTRALSVDRVEQLFALSFALGQLRSDLLDLEFRVREWKTV